MSEKNCMFKVSEKNYIFMFRNGDGVEYSCDSQWEAIDFARNVFNGDQPFAIHRVIIKLHEIGTMKRGTFTPAKQEPTIEDELIAAINRLSNCFPVPLDDYPDASMARQVFDAIEYASSVVTKAKGGAK